MKFWFHNFQAHLHFVAIFAGILFVVFGAMYLLGGLETPEGSSRLLEGEIVSLTPDPYHADLRTRWTAVVNLDDGRRGIVFLSTGVRNCTVGQRIEVSEFENGQLRATPNCREAAAEQ